MKLHVSGLTCMAGLQPLFSHCGFTLRQSQWLQLSGPNGTGKTTLLRALAGLVRPHEGRVQWQEEDVNTHCVAWRSRIHYLGHSAALKDVLSVRENLAFQCALDHARDLSPEVLQDLLTRVGLFSRASLAAARLSAGQRKRLQLARLIPNTAELWLLDEPANALDKAGVALLCELLEAHLAGGGMALVATHEPLPMKTPALKLDMAAFAPALRPVN